MLLTALKALFPSVTIAVGGKPYLTRLGKDRARGGLFLHRFHSSDRGDQLHDHPWAWGLSLVLSGGYSEERRQPDGTVARTEKRPGSLNLIRGTDFHRVDLLDERRGAWTLFLVGPRTKDWGFWDRVTGRFTDWRENPEAIP